MNHKRILLRAWSISIFSTYHFLHVALYHVYIPDGKRRAEGNAKVKGVWTLKKLSCGLSLSFCCLLLGNKVPSRGEQFWKGEYCFCLRQSLGAVVRGENVNGVSGQPQPLHGSDPHLYYTLISPVKTHQTRSLQSGFLELTKSKETVSCRDSLEGFLPFCVSVDTDVLFSRVNQFPSSFKL